MAEREPFSFDPSSLGIMSTEEVIDAGENFLNSDPSELTFVKPKTKVEEKEKEDDEEEKEEKVDKTKKKKEVKTEVAPSKEIKEDDVYGLMEKKVEEEEEEEKEEEIPLGKKKDGQKVPEKKKDDGDNKQDEPEESEYTVIAKTLVANGVFSEETDEEGNPIPIQIDTPEEFLEAFRINTRRQAADVIEKFLERHGDEYKEMFENVFVKGIPPQEYLNRYAKIESIKGLDLADEDAQERIVRELYRSEGRSAEYIDKKMLQHKNYNDLAEEAAEAQKLLLAKEEAAIQKAAADKQAEIARKTQIRNDYVTSVNKIITDKMRAKEFDGIPVDRKFAEKTYSYITQIKWQTPDKQDLTEFDKDILDLARPEHHELKVKLAMLLQMAKEDPKLTKIGKKAISKESNELFKGLKKNGQKSNNKKEEEQPEEKDNWFPN